MKTSFSFKFWEQKKLFFVKDGRYIYVTLYMTHDWYFSLKNITRIKIHIVSILHLKTCFSAYFLVKLKPHPPPFKPSFRSTLFILTYYILHPFFNRILLYFILLLYFKGDKDENVLEKMHHKIHLAFTLGELKFYSLVLKNIYYITVWSNAASLEFNQV